MMDETKQGQPGEVQFNLGSYQLMHISYLMNKASEKQIDGDMFGYFNSLRAIKLQIIGRLSQAERMELKERERILNKVLWRAGDPEDTPKLFGAVMTLVFAYHERVQELLEKAGYLVPLKEGSKSLFTRYEE